MAAKVFDGSLEFTSNIDDTQLTSDAAGIETSLRKIIKVAEEGNQALTESNQKQIDSAKQATTNTQALHDALQKIIEANNSAFDPADLQAYASGIEESAKAILTMVENTGSNFGEAKLKELDDQLKNTKSDSEQLSTIFKFLSENIADLKLSPTDARAFTEQINALSAALIEVNENATEAGQGVAESFQKSFPELDISTASIQQLEEELDRLIQKEGMLKRALNTTQDPENLALYQKGLQDVESRIGQIAEKLDNLNANKFKEDIEQTSKSTGNLLTQLRELRYAIAGAIKEYGEGSPEVIKLTQQAAELEQRMKNASKQVSLFASNTAGLDALKQGFNGLVGGVTSLIAATSLLSGDDNALQETMVKLFAVMQVMNGAEQLFAVLNKNSTVSAYLKRLMLKLATKATNDNTAATSANTAAKAINTATNEANAASLATEAGAAKAATGATAGLSGTLTALGSSLGVISIVLATVITVYEVFKQRARDAALAQELLNIQLKQSQDYTDGIVSGIKSTGQRVAAQMSANGATQAEINKEQLSNLQDQQTQYYKEANQSADNFAQLQRKLSDKYGAKQVDGKTTFLKPLSKDDAKNYKEAYDLFVQAQDKSLAASQAYEIKKLQNQKEATQQGLQDYSASLGAQIAAFKKSGEEENALELQKQKNLSDARAQAWGKDASIQNQIFAEAAEKNAEIDTQLKDLQISNAEAVAQKRLALAKVGSLDEYSAKAQLIDLNAQREILAAKGNQDKINAIKAQAQKAQDDLTDQTNAAEIEREKNAAISSVNARLEAVQKGSRDELDLKQQLINEKERFDLANVDFTIKNEQERQTAITNIQTSAQHDRLAAEKEFYDNLNNLKVEAIKRQASEKSLPFQAIQGNPLAADYEKDQAAINETLLRQSALQKELEIRITEYSSAVTRGATNLSDYQQKIDEVNAALKILNALLGNQKNQLLIDKSTAVSQNIQAVAQGFSVLSSNIQSANPELEQMAQLLSGLAGDANNLYLAFSKTMTEEEGYQAAISGVVGLVSMVINASAQRHQAEQQFIMSLLEQQNAYNKSLNEAILLNYQLKDSIFITDYQAQIKSGVEALNDAADKYSDALKKLSDVQVITGNRNAINWGNVLAGAGTGAAAGAALGSVVPVIGTAIGGVVGGIVGGIVGIFSKKSKDVLKPILQEYPELIDKTKQGVDQFNDALAQSLVDAKLVKGESAEVLNSLIQWKQAVEAANKQIEDAVSTLAGQLGDNLRDSLVQAFEDGTDAGQAFAKSVGDSLQNVLKQLLFNAIFGDALKNLQDKLTSTLENGGNVTDVYSQFFQTYSGLSKEFTDNLKMLQDQAAASGLDIFQSGSSQSNPNSLAGAIKAGITEETATLLEGQFNAMRLEEIKQTDLQRLMSSSMVKQIDLMMQHLNYAIKIETNTGRTAANTAVLVNIDKSLKSIDGKISDADAAKRANGVK